MHELLVNSRSQRTPGGCRNEHSQNVDEVSIGACYANRASVYQQPSTLLFELVCRIATSIQASSDLAELRSSTFTNSAAKSSRWVSRGCLIGSGYISKLNSVCDSSKASFSSAEQQCCCNGRNLERTARALRACGSSTAFEQLSYVIKLSKRLQCTLALVAAAGYSGDISSTTCCSLPQQHLLLRTSGKRSSSCSVPVTPTAHPDMAAAAGSACLLFCFTDSKNEVLSYCC